MLQVNLSDVSLSITLCCSIFWDGLGQQEALVKILLEEQKEIIHDLGGRQ